MRRLLALAERLLLPLTLLLLAAIAVLSLAPVPQPPVPAVQSPDKLHHFVAYAALALPAALARPRGWPWWFAGFLALGAAIEVAQPFVNRQGELADLAANAAGLGLGFLAGSALRALGR